jgi:integrase
MWNGAIGLVRLGYTECVPFPMAPAPMVYMQRATTSSAATTNEKVGQRPPLPRILSPAEVDALTAALRTHRDRATVAAMVPATARRRSK